MLVQCRNCGVSFDSAMGRCVACRAEYVPTKEESQAVGSEQAYQLLRGGARALAVRDHLASELGFSDQDADGILATAQARLREESRQQGRHIATSGVVLLAIAAAVFVFTGGFLIATGCLAFGGAMAGLGTLKSWTGWNLTGHDDD